MGRLGGQAEPCARNTRGHLAFGRLRSSEISDPCGFSRPSNGIGNSSPRWPGIAAATAGDFCWASGESRDRVLLLANGKPKRSKRRQSHLLEHHGPSRPTNQPFHCRRPNHRTIPIREMRRTRCRIVIPQRNRPDSRCGPIPLNPLQPVLTSCHTCSARFRRRTEQLLPKGVLCHPRNCSPILAHAVRCSRAPQSNQHGGTYE